MEGQSPRLGYHPRKREARIVIRAHAVLERNFLIQWTKKNVMPSPMPDAFWTIGAKKIFRSIGSNEHGGRMGRFFRREPADLMYKLVRSYLYSFLTERPPVAVLDMKISRAGLLGRDHNRPRQSFEVRYGSLSGRGFCLSVLPARPACMTRGSKSHYVRGVGTR